MKKMNKPEVEAVRFDSNDVIATSGAGPTYPGAGNSLGGAGNGYYTIGREFDQYNQYQNISQAIIYDYYSSNDDGASWTGVDNPNTGAHYAWFNNGAWYTVVSKILCKVQTVM